MKSNRCEVAALELDDAGAGVGPTSNRVVHVADLLPGERAEVDRSMKYLLGLGVGLAIVVGCKSPKATPGDAPEPDVAVDMAPDVSLDAASDVANDARSPSPACLTAPTPLIDIAPGLITGMGRSGDTLYVAGWAAATGAQLFTIDLTTGTQSAAPFTLGDLAWITPSGGDAFANEYGASDGTIWRLHPGAAPDAWIQHRPQPDGVTVDATHAYWVESGGMHRQSLAGGLIESLVNCGSHSLTNLAEYVYCGTDTGMVRVRKDGTGAVETVLPPTGRVFATTTVDGNAYFVPGTPSPTLYSVNNTTAMATALTSVSGMFVGELVASDDYFYLADAPNAIRRVHRTTHHEELVWQGRVAFGLTLWNDQLYFAAHGSAAATANVVMHCVD